MKHILSLSYGKDSIACLEAIRRLGLPLDEIQTVDVMATPTISANLPEVEEFKVYADKVIKERYGLEVKHIKGGVFEEGFYNVKKRGKYIGNIYGFPSSSFPSWCTNFLKVSHMKDGIYYVGIAADEKNRIREKSNFKKYPLVQIGWTEEDCFKWCKENNLLSPVYEHSARDGCWFCPKQRLSELRRLYKEYPHLWEILEKWQKDSPRKFKYTLSVFDYRNRFKAEDEGKLPSSEMLGRKFRWEMVDALLETTNNNNKREG